MDLSTVATISGDVDSLEADSPEMESDRRKICEFSLNP